MRINNIILACCGLGLAGVGEANAVIIDDFNVPAGGQIISITGGVAGSTTHSLATGLAGVLGGSRYIQADVQAAFGGGNSTVLSANDPATAPDDLNLATDVNVDSKGTARWDANGAGLNANLAPAVNFELFDVSNDLPTSYTVKITTFGGGTSSSTVLTGTSTFDVNLFFPLAGFVGGANLAKIDQITLIVDTPRSGDARIHTFEYNIPSVPDGGLSMMLLGGSLIGLSTLRRKLQIG
jgi:hypothetical protein